VKISPAPP